jgi:anaerobic selenocysteine-containing dehydrogenase
MTAPDMKGRLRAIRDRGGRIVVVDPRRTETGEIADQYVPIRPGTDALLLAAMLHVVFAEGMVRLGRLGSQVKNVDVLAALVREFPPERVARRTGVAPEITRQLARDFASATRAACYGRVGLCTQRYGTVAAWLVQALNLVTGHLDEVGGMMLTTPAVDAVAILSRLGRRGTYDRWRSRAQHLPEFAGELPVAALADEIEMGGPGQVRALITVAGNPVLSAPKGPRLNRALDRLEHVVSIDGYLNETTRHAHVILPPASVLSRAHYDLALLPFAVHNVAKYSEPVVPRHASERLDWEIVIGLASRVFVPRVFRRPALVAAMKLRPERIVDALLRIGPHRLTLAGLRQHPHGVDLGPLEPGRFRDRIATPDRLANVAPDDFVREARARLPLETGRDTAGELSLIGRRQLRDNNSWMHNSKRLVKGPPRCTLLVHPVDAASRNLASGDLARLRSDTGTVVVPVEVTAAILEGVVSLPHGWGHNRDGTRLGVAQKHPGASVNDVTSNAHLDTLSGNAAFNGLAVTLERAGD